MPSSQSLTPYPGKSGDTASRNPIFTIRGLTKIYRNGAVEVRALQGIDFDVEEGEVAVLLGPSGSGKSTLLNILGGLDQPSAGTVKFRKADLAGLDDAGLTAYRRNYVGFVFQFYNLVPSLTARENVALVTDIAVDPMRPEDALAHVGLADRLDHFPAQLSGGEQQRVAIARNFFLVAPDDREDEVRAQFLRPAFSRVNDLDLRYLPYSQLQEHRESMARFGSGLKAVLSVARPITKAR